jgi:hypothetical protein
MFAAVKHYQMKVEIISLFEDIYSTPVQKIERLLIEILNVT